jgi:hypothetical protein
MKKPNHITARTVKIIPGSGPVTTSICQRIAGGLGIECWDCDDYFKCWDEGKIARATKAMNLAAMTRQ